VAGSSVTDHKTVAMTRELREPIYNFAVQVVDLRPIFRANKSPYLYQRADAHWNPCGISLALVRWPKLFAVSAPVESRQPRSKHRNSPRLNASRPTADLVGRGA
jgi:hypothetical protein